jgi:hypothetical protein
MLWGEPLLMLHRQALEMEQAFAAAWTEGQQMTLDQAPALATENEGEDSPLPKGGTLTEFRLTVCFEVIMKGFQ